MNSSLPPEHEQWLMEDQASNELVVKALSEADAALQEAKEVTAKLNAESENLRSKLTAIQEGTETRSNFNLLRAQAREEYRQQRKPLLEAASQHARELRELLAQIKSKLGGSSAQT